MCELLAERIALLPVLPHLAPCLFEAERKDRRLVRVQHEGVASPVEGALHAMCVEVELVLADALRGGVEVGSCIQPTCVCLCMSKCIYAPKCLPSL